MKIRKCRIIAESATNHNGDLDYLKQLALASKQADADYFTIQILHVDSFCDSNYSKKEFFYTNTIPYECWPELFAFCRESNIALLPCPLDMKSLNLVTEHAFRFIKIHATDITNVSLLEEIARRNMSVLLETQVATLQDIYFSLSYIQDNVRCLMHGFSDYPTELQDLNMNAIDYIRQEWPQYETGFADHTLSTDVIPAMAIAKGCQYIEKHITLARNERRYDWQVSLEPEEFKAFASNVNQYEKALGNQIKHPNVQERKYRDILYKKRIDTGNGTTKYVRADHGDDHLAYEFNRFDRSKAGVAIIARLKSKRLPLKALKPIGDHPLILQLYRRLLKSLTVQEIFLATSSLPEDDPLVTIATDYHMPVFRGHPISVIDRMLSLVLEQKWGAVFRVTGDNLFTDPDIIDAIYNLYIEHDLDYVRATGVPLGVSAELYSSKYLWKLYLDLDNTLDSEYLSWFVLQDSECRKGRVHYDLDQSYSHINLSIDYKEDLESACHLIDRILKPYRISSDSKARRRRTNSIPTEKSSTKHSQPGRLLTAASGNFIHDRYISPHDFADIDLPDIIHHIKGWPTKDPNDPIKLPKGQVMTFGEYMTCLETADYIAEKRISVNDPVLVEA